MDIAAVGVGVRLTLDGDAIKDARICLGAVAPTPSGRRMPKERSSGQSPADDMFRTRAALAREEAASPISDARGSADFRRYLVETMTKRCLEIALERAKAAKGWDTFKVEFEIGDPQRPALGEAKRPQLIQVRPIRVVPEPIFERAWRCRSRCALLPSGWPDGTVFEQYIGETRVRIGNISATRIVAFGREERRTVLLGARYYGRSAARSGSCR